MYVVYNRIHSTHHISLHFVYLKDLHVCTATHIGHTHTHTHTDHTHTSTTPSPVYNNMCGVLISMVGNPVHLLARDACSVIQVPGNTSSLSNINSILHESLTCIHPYRREPRCLLLSQSPPCPADRVFQTLTRGTK